MWTDHNGKKKNDAVAADASATHRGGALYLDAVTLQQELVPWSDGSGDSITIDFVLPGPIQPPVPTPVGWEGVVSNSDTGNGSWSAGVADLGGVKGLGKLSDALDGFIAPGSNAYVRIPFDDVPSSDPEWRPVKKRLGGNWRDFAFNIQPREITPLLTSLGTTTIPDYYKGAIVIQSPKRGDYPNTKYMTGQGGIIPPPVFVGFRANGTTVTGVAFGWWEFDGVTGELTKCVDANTIRNWPSQTATIVCDATFGYTVTPTLVSTNPQPDIYYETGPWNGDAGYQIDSFSVNAWNPSNPGAARTMRLWATNTAHASGRAKDIVAGSEINTGILPSTQQYVTAVLGTPAVGVAATNNFVCAQHSGGSPFNSWGYNTGTFSPEKVIQVDPVAVMPSAIPDPMPDFGSIFGSFMFAMYATYSEGGGGFLERGIGRGIGRGIMRGF